ncbi:MAG: Coq4 family protein, partial [Myxococcota bacterium]
VIARATVRVLRDSTRTDEILRVEELLCQSKLTGYLRTMADRPEMQRMLRERPAITPETVDFDQLRALPADTLGGAYVRHLDRNQLLIDPQIMAPKFIDDPYIAYLLGRARQTHDIWHPLLDLGTLGHEEVLVHSFMYGQLGLPSSAMIVFFGGLKHFVAERRWSALRHSIYQSYHNGRTATSLLPVVWEELWTEPLDELRRRFGIVLCHSARSNQVN